tara:strand:- start:114 stop:605 length:492 start_codon:yes stop_codon:yes gene_type:complete
MSNTYRFNFSKQLLDILIPFVNINKYSDTQSFNENWNVWLKQNNNVIQNENKLLITKGYNGDIYVKLYKSAKYYYKKKKKKKSVTKRKPYIGIDHQILNLIDDHITSIRINIKPHDSYLQFIELYKNNINIEYKRLINILNKNDFDNKIKKTYKNRFYILKKH